MAWAAARALLLQQRHRILDVCAREEHRQPRMVGAQGCQWLTVGMTSWRSSDGVSSCQDACRRAMSSADNLSERWQDCVKEGTYATGAVGAGEDVAGEVTAGAMGSVAARSETTTAWIHGDTAAGFINHWFFWTFSMNGHIRRDGTSKRHKSTCHSLMLLNSISSPRFLQLSLLCWSTEHEGGKRTLQMFG